MEVILLRFVEREVVYGEHNTVFLDSFAWWGCITDFIVDWEFKSFTCIMYYQVTVVLKEEVSKYMKNPIKRDRPCLTTYSGRFFQCHRDCTLVVCVNSSLPKYSSEYIHLMVNSQHKSSLSVSDALKN